MATIPHEHDVLFGRGIVINAHPGNQRLRGIVERCKAEFFASKRNERRKIAIKIVDEIYNLQPPGRFLVEDPNGNGRGGTNGMLRLAGAPNPNIQISLLKKAWVCQNTEKAIEKVLHRLREKKDKNGGGGANSSSKGEMPDRLPLPAVAPGTKPCAGSPVPSSPTPVDHPAVASETKLCAGYPASSSFSQVNHNQCGANVPGAEQQFEDTNTTSPNMAPETKTLAARVNSDSISSSGQIEPNQYGVNALETDQKSVDTKAKSSVPVGDVTEDELHSFLHQIQENLASGDQEQQEQNSEQHAFCSPHQEVQLKEDMKVASGDFFDDVSNVQCTNTERVDSTAISHERDLDDELDSFLRDFSSQYDGNDETLREWIVRTLTKLNQKQTTVAGQASEYVKAALPVALKLTACLSDAERTENEGIGHHIPLSNISTKNVVVRTKDLSSNEGQNVEEVIDCVWSMSCAGHSVNGGDVMSQLFALGLVLYELISGEELPFEAGTAYVNITPSNSLSMNSINLNSKHHSSKKFQRQSSRYSERIYNCIDRLESLDIPWSLKFLVSNLLDCSNGDLRGDDAYTSFGDLQADLNLMMSDPARFLDDIETNPMPHLSICNKLYGREDEIKRLEKSYHKYLSRMCSGVVIAGHAGVGKSSLATHVVQELTSQAHGHFLVAKYDQSKEIKPLSTLLNLFNSLCDLFAQDATPSQLCMVDRALDNALGSQAALLTGLLPNLPKIMPTCARFSPPRDGDFTMSLGWRFLLCELLGVISCHSNRISFFLDDLQWADEESLLLVESLISSTEGSSSVFFTCCYRNEDVTDNVLFERWLNSVSIHLPESIKLGNLTNDGVNKLVSDTLRLSPRITRPLSSVLHHKTRGNPLFLRQLLGSLEEQGHIHVNLRKTRWDWDLDKITELKISDDVLSLLIEDLQGLPSDLREGLKLASCLGACAKYDILLLLSNDFMINLQDILNQVSQKGFMNNTGGKMFQFEHDKIQQAVYEKLMTDQQRSELHMRIGLAICAQTLNTNAENDEQFFTAVDQINKGGPGVVHDPSQKTIIAALNLKAGRRAIMFDTNAAKAKFEQGISFLCTDHWQNEYDLSINLFDAVAESACVLNDRAAVTFYTEKLFSHARCYDDKLNCLCAAAEVLRQAELKQESMETTLAVLQHLGEERLRPMGDVGLHLDMQKMDMLLDQRTDESIFTMQETMNEKKTITLVKLYANLIHLLHFLEPLLVGAASLRMLEITWKKGFCLLTPLAYAYYGEVLVSTGKLDSGSRLAGISLKLLEKRGASRHKASVITIVYQTILWASIPWRDCVEGLLTGHRAGMQSGDYLYSSLSFYLSLMTSYIAGYHLKDIRENSRKYASKKPDYKTVITSGHPTLLHLQSCVLMEGLQVLDAESIDNLPGKTEILADAANAKDRSIFMSYEIHQRTNALFFSKLDGILLGVRISDIVSQKKTLLRPPLVFALFIEGLISFHLARRTDENEEWITIGDSVLENMTMWTENCSWNFMNKKLLLLAEKERTVGKDFDQAESYYLRSIRSAKEHKIIHEEGIASKLAGDFFYERGLYPKAFSLFTHAIGCYEKWGANAVARAIEGSIQKQFGTHLIPPKKISMSSFFATNKESSSKKRQESG